MDLTPKQQTSEAIRQAETIIILTGQHPSVDQATAVMALAAILRKFGKKVMPIISDNAPASVGSLEIAGAERAAGGSRDFVLKLDVTKTEVDKLRYEVADGKLNIYLTPFKGSFAPSDVTFGYSGLSADLAIVLGVPTRARIDKVYEQNASSFDTIPVVNLDFHRSNENYGAVNLIEPNASSLCEMLVALSESLQSGIIDAEIATALLMGIVASTDRFTAAHTSPKSLTVAAQMMAAGARQQAVVKALYRDNSKGEPRGGQNDQRASQNEPRSGQSEQRGGQDRSERDRGERSSERSDRGQDRNRDRDRQNRSEPQSAQTPQPQAQTQPQAEPVTALASVAAASPEPSKEADFPIIQPSHIEMSQPEHVEKTPETITPASVPERSPMPSGDFATAAEMFSLDNLAAADGASDRDQS